MPSTHATECRREVAALRDDQVIEAEPCAQRVQFGARGGRDGFRVRTRLEVRAAYQQGRGLAVGLQVEAGDELVAESIGNT